MDDAELEATGPVYFSYGASLMLIWMCCATTKLTLQICHSATGFGTERRLRLSGARRQVLHVALA